jgi:integrase
VATDGANRNDRVLVAPALAASAQRVALGECQTLHLDRGYETFVDDLALWGWAQRPARPLVHRSDLPRLPEAVPRVLSPDGDRDLMTAVDQLDDPVARGAMKILRRTGLRPGQLLDLELDCVIDCADHGAWLRVPVGKLSDERTVSLDQPILEAFDDWGSRRVRCGPLIHPLGSHDVASKIGSKSNTPLGV